MTDTPNLLLPYIAAAQAQKHVTHNEAIRALDAIVQLSVADRDLTAAPGAPTDGDRYIVAAAATGTWAGKDLQIAAYQDGAWAYYPPREGWLAWVADEDKLLGFDGATWNEISSGGGGGGSVNPAPLVGVNATADATNRLSVSSPNSLFNHEGTGHRVKINKASVTDTAAILYQNNFSGRAEIGLTGDDDFHFKVSADGAAFKEAILIDKDSGAVSFPALATPSDTTQTPVIRVSTNITINVPADFAVIQDAINALNGYFFEGNAQGIIEIADGTYPITEPLKFPHPQKNRIVLQGLNAAIKPLEADFTGTKATDETMIRSKYNVIIECQDCTGIDLTGGEGIGLLRYIAIIRTTGVSVAYGMSLANTAFANIQDCCFFGFNYGLYAEKEAFLSLSSGARSVHSGTYNLMALDGSYISGIDFLSMHAGSHGAYVEASSAKFNSSAFNNNGSFGVSGNYGSNINLTSSSTDNNTSHGFLSQYGGAVVLINHSTQNNSGLGIILRGGVAGYVQSITVAGGATPRTLRAENNSTITEALTHTGTPVWSPAVGTEGNNGAWVI